MVCLVCGRARVRVCACFVFCRFKPAKKRHLCVVFSCSGIYVLFVVLCGFALVCVYSLCVQGRVVAHDIGTFGTFDT